MPGHRHVGLAAAIVSSTILGAALPALVAHADVTALYVDNSEACSDTGSGAQSLPFCTVQAAVNAAQPGQTVLIAAGRSFPEQITVTHSGTQGSPITVRAVGAQDGMHGGARIGVTASDAMGFAYNQAGQRVIEAVEGGVLHEVYSDSDGWHDGAGSNINNLSVKIRPTGDRVIEAVESNTLHEIYTSAGSWLDSITPIGRTPVSAVSLALR